jgi:leader peptidase (prepilin peptidase)/N-methyltransferase
MIEMTLIVVAFGLALGSFLNVCIDRLPRGQSILRPRSHCPGCKTTLAARDMVPVVSYLLLRGRCRYCSAPIPKRVLLVEAGTGLLFLLAWSLHVASLHFLLAVLIASALIPVIVIGLEHRLQRGVRNGVRR